MYHSGHVVEITHQRTTTETPYGEATSSPDPRRLGTETIEYLEEPSRLVSARSARARSSSGTLALSVPLWTSRSLAEPISLVRLRVRSKLPHSVRFFHPRAPFCVRARGGAAYDLPARLMSQPNRRVRNGPERCPHAASSARGTKRRESCSDRWSWWDGMSGPLRSRVSDGISAERNVRKSDRILLGAGSPSRER